MKYKNELKKIDTQEKAYFLGFMYGDGTITNYKEKTGRERFLTKISISMVDENLITKLHKAFPFFNKSSFDYSKYNSNSTIQYSLAKSSKELYNDLLLNGVYPRKSYENKDKLIMPLIEDRLIPHFIRGLFDADGSVYVRAKRKNLITIEFVSASINILTNIDSYLKANDIYSWKILKKKPTGKGKQIYYILQFIKTSEIMKLINLMYDDATIYLDRKYEKCISYKPVDKVGDRDMICPECGCNRIKRNGVRGNSIRYKCNECSKGFSIKINKKCPNAHYFVGADQLTHSLI
jgi:intein-encoded DNA endonuclease-like protein